MLFSSFILNLLISPTKVTNPNFKPIQTMTQLHTHQKALILYKDLLSFWDVEFAGKTMLL